MLYYYILERFEYLKKPRGSPPLPVRSSSHIVAAERTRRSATQVLNLPTSLGFDPSSADTEREVQDPMAVEAAGPAQLGSLPRSWILRSRPATQSGRGTRSGSLDG